MELKKINSNKLISKKYNYGLGVLKVILAFYVVRTHNFKNSSTKNRILLYILKKRGAHVPSFFIMSFYFVHKDLLLSNIKIYLKRIERLLIPYLLWPIIIFILNNYILNNFFAIKRYSFNDLKNQFLIANGIMAIFWFQWNLVMLTTIFFLIIYLCKKKYLFLIQIFGCFAYFIQYSGYNKIFKNYLRPEKRLTLVGFSISVPFASTGFTLASLKILNIITNHKIEASFFSLYIFYFLDKYSIFTRLNYHIYSGVIYNVRAIVLIFIFSLFPSNKITNIKIEKIIKYITNYTAGIYYLHQKIALYCKNFISPIKNGTLFGVFIIYFFCYLICFIGMQIFGKTKLKNLFL